MSLSVKEYRSCAIRKVSISPSRQAVMDVFLQGEGGVNKSAAVTPRSTATHNLSRQASSRVSADGGENPEQQRRVGRSPSPAMRPWQSNSGPLINLSNFESINHGQDTINSPRSVALCQEYGIRVSELIPRSLNQFRGAGVPLNIAQLRFDHYEKRRAEKVDLLKEEREHRIRNAAAEKHEREESAAAARERNNKTPSAAATPRQEAAAPEPSSTTSKAGRSHRSVAADESADQQNTSSGGEDQPVLGLLSEYTKDLIVRGTNNQENNSHNNKENNHHHNHSSASHAKGTPGQATSVPRVQNMPRATGSRSSTPRAFTPRSTTPSVAASAQQQNKVPAALRRLNSATVPDDVRNARAEMLMERENRRRLVYERAQKVKEERQCESLLKQLDSQRRSEYQRATYDQERRGRLETQRLCREDLTETIQQKKRQEEYKARQDAKKLAQVQRSSSAKPADKYQVQLAKSMYMTPRQRTERSRSASVQPNGTAATMHSYTRVDSGRR